MTDIRTMLRIVACLLVATVIATLPTGLASLQAQDSSSSILAYRELMQLGGRGTTEEVAWSLDGEMLAVSGSQGIWLYTTEFENVSHFVLDAFDYRITDVQWSNDGTRIAGLTGFYGDLQIWDVDTEEFVLNLDAERRITAYVWSPDSNMIASAFGSGDEYSVTIWDVASGTILSSLSGYTAQIYSLSWSPDGTRLATASGDSTVSIWVTETWQIERTLSDFNGIVFSVAWNSSGNRLASVGRTTDTTTETAVLVWDRNFDVIFDMPATFAQSVAWNPQVENQIALSFWIGSKQAQIWDIEAQTEIATIGSETHYGTAVAWHPNGQQIAVASLTDFVSIFDVGSTSTQLVRTLEGHSWYLREFAWSPDSLQMATAESIELETRIKIWDIATQQLLYAFDTPNNFGIQTLSWSPDGRFIATTYDGRNEIHLWDVRDGPPSSYTTLRHQLNILSLSWGPDGSQLVSIGSTFSFDSDFEVYVWDTDSGGIVSILEDANHTVAAAWSPDGQYFVTLTEDGILQFRDLTTFEILSTLTSPEVDGSLIGLVWSSDGQYLVGRTSGHAVNRAFLWTWNVVADRASERFEEDQFAPYWIAWQPNSHLLTSANDIGEVVFWDINTGQILTTLDGYNSAFEWCPDGGRLATHGNDVVRIWEVQYSE